MTSLFLILRKRFFGTELEIGETESTLKQTLRKLVRLIENGFRQVVRFFKNIDNRNKKSKLKMALSISIADLIVILSLPWLNYLEAIIKHFEILREVVSEQIISIGNRQLYNGKRFSKKGIHKVAEEKYLQANYWYGLAVKIEPDNRPAFSKRKTLDPYLEAHLKLGEVNEKLGKYDLAISYYKVVEKGGNDSAGLSIARVYMRQKKYDLADDWLWTILESRGNETFLRQDDSFAFDILKTLAQYHLYRNDLESSKRWLKLGIDAIGFQNSEKRRELVALESRVIAREANNSETPISSGPVATSPNRDSVSWFPHSYRGVDNHYKPNFARRRLG